MNEGRAERQKESHACFWHRGLVPTAWTQRPPIPAEVIHEVNSIQPEERFDPNGIAYLDGSGGECSKDPRLRACGWAWIQKYLHDITLEPEFNAIGMYGSLEGYQSVPRAELTALIRFFTFLVGLGPGKTGNHTVYTDNKMVYQGFTAGRHIGHGNMSDLWQLMWDLYQNLEDAGWTITLKRSNPMLLRPKWLKVLALQNLRKAMT